MEIVRDRQVEGTLALHRGGLLSLVIISLLRPSERINFGLFKYASFLHTFSHDPALDWGAGMKTDC